MEGLVDGDANEKGQEMEDVIGSVYFWAWKEELQQIWKIKTTPSPTKSISSIEMFSNENYLDIT